MPAAVASRRLPSAAAGSIAVVAGGLAAGYARQWLDLLGRPAGAAVPAGRIVIAGGAGDRDVAAAWPDADCVIRLWDFQAGHDGSGILASAASGASAVLGHRGGRAGWLPADLPEKWCAAYGVVLALAEAWRRRDGAPRPRVLYDVSAADVLRAFSLQNAGDADETARLWRRNGRLCVEHGGIFPMGFFACRDGHVAVLGRSRRDWRNIRAAIGDPAWAHDPAFEDPFAIARDSAAADRLLEATLAAFGRDELLRRGLASGAVIAPVYSREEAAERGIFRDGFVGADGSPGLPALVRAFAGTDGARGARPRSPPAVPATAEAPLAGLRCIELCWVWSGPMVGQILADLGAEVIKVEAPARFDLYRTRGVENLRGRLPEAVRLESSLYFHSLNRNKVGLALDLKRAAGAALLGRLAGASDMLLENFTVGTMERLGLAPAVLAAANPALVQLSMSGPGRGSAVQALRSYGLVLSALAGAEQLIRDDEDAFLGSPTFSISDPTAAVFGAMTALAGVLAAGEDGRGRLLDLSQIEAAATLAGTTPAEAPPRRLAAMLAAADGGSVAVDLPAAAFADAAALRAALSGRPATEIAAACAARGGRAEPVLELGETAGAAVFADCPGGLPALHAVTGAETLVAAPWRVDGRRPGLRKPAPLLGEGDDYVLRRVLGLADGEIDALRAAGVVGRPADRSERDPGEAR